MSTQTLHFSITGEYLTDIARACWVEGNPSKALNILNSAFPTMAETTKIDICMGRKKLVGTNSCTVQPDNATEHNGIPFRTITEQVKAREDAVALREREVLARAEMQADEVTRIPSPWGLVRVPNSMVAWRYTKPETRPYIKPEPGETHEQTLARFEKLFPDEVERAREETNQAMIQRRLDDQIRLMGFNPEVAKARLAEVVAEPTQRPGPDSELRSLNGWILPDGKFYGCHPMGHVGLADWLGSTEGKAEKAWVKVQDYDDPMAFVPRGTTSFPSIPERGVTQRQYDTMFAWCEKHRRPFPNDLEIR